MKKKRPFSGPISLRAARPLLFKRAIQKKGEQGWFGNKQTALYHSSKGAVRLNYLSTKGCFRFHKRRNQITEKEGC